MKKYNLLNKYLCILVFASFINSASAQNGLNFQGVARTSNNVIIASQDISLKLSILQGSATGIPEYVEMRKVKTNAQGLFTAVIGDSETTITLGNFADIDWKLSPKFLKIEIDPFAGNNFISMGTTQFQYVAYAKFANSVLAENISGLVPVARGGTGTNSLTTLKSNLALDKVNNTADSSKPISKSTQSALDQKLNIVDSTKAYVTPFQLASFKFSTTTSSIDTINLSNRINLKSNSVDTASLFRKSDTTNLYNRINLKLNIADTASLLRKSDTTILYDRINLKLNIADTVSLLKKIDTTSLSNRIDFKLNINDTTSLFRKSDTSTLSNRINLKLTKSDTSTLSNRINYKLNILDTSSLFRKSQVGAINGAASLDATGKVPSVQIPAISFSSVDVVNSQAEMLGFTNGMIKGHVDSTFVTIQDANVKRNPSLILKGGIDKQINEDVRLRFSASMYTNSSNAGSGLTLYSGDRTGSNYQNVMEVGQDAAGVAKAYTAMMSSGRYNPGFSKKIIRIYNC